MLKLDRKETTAHILAEALPYIQKFSNRTVVVKYGGNAMTDPSLQASFARDIVLIRAVGILPVVVHGGGPQIELMLQRLGIESHFIDGIRVTSPEAMKVVEMVLGGIINTEIVQLINQAGGQALGLTGKDVGFIKARKLSNLRNKSSEKPNANLDVGNVGEIEKIDPKILNLLANESIIPVVAPIGYGTNGETYNINADIVAGTLASTLGAEKLILLTNTGGVIDAKNQIISTLTSSELQAQIDKKIITGGMVPKVLCAIKAIEQGVGTAHIIDGRVPHAVLLEILTDQGVGTQIL